VKALFVSQAYPPYPIVGSLRAEKIAGMLRDRGHDVTVITERLEGEHGDVRMTADRLTVRTVHAGLPYRLRLVALRNRLLGRSVALSSWDGPNAEASHLDTSTRNRGPSGPAAAFKRFIIGLLRLPDDQQQFVPPALRLSRRIVREGVDLVYTTAPAFSTHIVGLLLRRAGNVRWIAEFRDPWTSDQPRRGQHAAVPALEVLNRWMERRCLARADVIVAVTESVGRQIAAKLPPAERGKIVVAMNGIHVLEPRRTSSGRSGPYRIVHTGSFYHDRDPRPFLEALAGWMRDSRLGAGDVLVDFAGRCRHYADVSVEQIVHELGLDEIVHFHDWLAHEAAQEMLREADLVLLLARSQPAQVPNKLFDYLGARAPILAVVDEGGESASILNAVGGQYVIAPAEGAPVSTGDMREALERAYAHRGEPANTNETALEALLTTVQFRHLAEAIGV
jgi:glycosyltransferase involved in cell wall biosynthesis